jgi:sorting and assembly machinery component 37
LALANGRQLIDLYLYASSNFISTTRPAFATIFPLHINYTVPPALRKQAVARTEHLGLDQVLKSSSEDSDDTTVKVQNSSFPALPDSFTIGSRRKELSVSQKRIRLERLIARLMGPFVELLGEKEYLMSNDQPSTLDAIILGYFGLVQNVKVPDSWAADIVLEKYPSLAGWLSKNYTP